jgi:acyl carrier protein
MIAVEGGKEQRLYRTGDLALRRADGGIQLAGRADQQIKLRGFRIELGDIESVLRNADNVSAAAVALGANASGDPCLVGYVVPMAGTLPTPQQLKRNCAEALPEYMVPALWHTLESLPLTPNGKLDRKALPAPTLVAMSADPSRTDVNPPETELEKSIAAIWCDVLGLKEVGKDQSIFSLGTDSLQIFRIAARLADKGIAVQAKHIMEFSEIGALANYVEQARNSEGPVGSVVSSLKDFRNGARRRQKVSPAE